MQAYAFDTNASVKKLEKSGFTRTQAEAVTEVLNEAASSSLVTKHDLELALEKQTTKLIIWMTGALFAQGAFVITILQYLQ